MILGLFNMTYPHGGKYSNDPYFLTDEEEKKLEHDFDDDEDSDYCECPVIHDDNELGGICASCGKLVD
jgi:hypothetical protein